MALVTTRTSLSCSSSPPECFLRAFCLARSRSLASLMNASVLPSGDQAGAETPSGTSVTWKASPPCAPIRWICGCLSLSLSFPPSSDLWSRRATERRKAIQRPSGDQRGEESCGPVVNGRAGALPSAGTIQSAVS